jgi:hypothetical protein
MKSVLSILLVTGSLLATGRLSESRGQEEKKAERGAVKLHVNLEDINIKDSGIFLTGTFRITQVGGETVSSKLVDVPVEPGVKINVNWQGTSRVLRLVEDQGGLVVVGTEAVEKGREQKKDASRNERSEKRRSEDWKAPIAPRMVLAVNLNPEEKLVILEEMVADYSDPEKPRRYTEFSQFSLKRGHAYWGDGKPIMETELWRHLPKSTSDSGRTILLSADERALGPHYLKALKPDTIILIGKASFRGVSPLEENP